MNSRAHELFEGKISKDEVFYDIIEDCGFPGNLKNLIFRFKRDKNIYLK